MANICEYRLRVKGKKEDCNLFLYSMPAYNFLDPITEEGTDDNFIIEAVGDCKWDLYSYVEETPDDYNHTDVRKNIKDEEDCYDLWYIPLKDKTKIFNVEVQVSWADIDNPIANEDGSIKYNYEHWNNGEEITPIENEHKEEFFVFELITWYGDEE
jgi:hypothetical protein